MEFLILSLNELSGTIPSSIGSMPLLKELLLDRCPMLTGTIPDTFGNLQSLEFVSLWGNSLSGTLPQGLTGLPSLEVLQIQGNALTGTIPPFRSRGPMKRLKIGYNMFEGSIPDSIYELSSLEILDLDEGFLTGTISPKISNLVNKLEMFLICCNEIRGTLPSEFGQMIRLTNLEVSVNAITGTIPSELGNLFRVQPATDDALIYNGLWMTDNMLTGTIPSELGNMLELGGLGLSGNLLTGTVPTQLGQLVFLRDGYILLDNNNLTGSLDEVFCMDTPSPIFLSADCDEVNCTCCSQCCTNSGGGGDAAGATSTECIANVPAICESMADRMINVYNPPEWGTTCECSNGGEENTTATHDEEVFVNLSCQDTACVSCSADGITGCLESVDYGYDLTEDGSDHLYHCTMKYLDGPAAQHHSQVTYRIDLLAFECTISIDGVECNSCLEDRRCSDDFTGFRVDCSNIEEGAIYDDCDPTLTGGNILKFLNPEYFEQDCYPCIY